MEQYWCWACQKMCNFADRLTGNCMTDPYSNGCIEVIYTDNKTYPTNTPMYGNNTTGTIIFDNPNIIIFDDEYRKMDFD